MLHPGNRRQFCLDVGTRESKVFCGWGGGSWEAAGVRGRPGRRRESVASLFWVGRWLLGGVGRPCLCGWVTPGRRWESVGGLCGGGDRSGGVGSPCQEFRGQQFLTRFRPGLGLKRLKRFKRLRLGLGVETVETFQAFQAWLGVGGTVTPGDVGSPCLGGTVVLGRRRESVFL